MAATGMPWFRVNTGWEDHPKVQAFVDAIGNPLGAIYVERLWDWTARFYPQGSIAASTAGVERALRWRGRAGGLVGALGGAGLLDGSEGAFSPHDWEEHNGAAFRKWDTDRNRRKPSTSSKQPTKQPDKEPSETRAGFDRVPEMTVRTRQYEQDGEEEPGAKAPVVEQAPLLDLKLKPATKKSPKRPTEIQALADRWKAMWCKLTETPEAEFHWADGLFLRFQAAVKNRTIDIVVKATRANGKEPKLVGQPALTWLSDFWLDAGLARSRGAVAIQAGQEPARPQPPPFVKPPEPELPPIENREEHRKKLLALSGAKDMNSFLGGRA